MSVRQLVQLRKFSTTRILRKSFLSSSYKSRDLWDQRFNCKLLCDEQIIKSINTKIITGNDLNNWEIDIFINISTPQVDEIAQLQESVRLLGKLRKSLYAHTILPSTPHAVCRLFLYSQRLTSLISLLERRVDYGVFPDFFAMNLLLDQAIDEENYMVASRLAALVMLQEEFGSNSITDRLSLLSVARYIESKPDFKSWMSCNNSHDPIFVGDSATKPEASEREKQEQAKKEEQDEEDDEDDEDAEYIRVPFLRNPYFDKHFDIQNPRVTCGKTLSTLGQMFTASLPEISTRSRLMGSVLQGNWLEASVLANEFAETKTDLGPMKEQAKFYLENLHDIDEPDQETKAKLLSALEAIPDSSSQTLAELAHSQCQNLSQNEEGDIQQLTKDIDSWSTCRQAWKQRQEDNLFKKKLRLEIEAKKEELKLKEQYLYFYDNLKKSRATRIDYD